MPRFFIGETDGITAVISGEDARHMALSLRMKKGGRVTVCDETGSDYQCAITDITPERVLLRVERVMPGAGEPRARVTLYQAFPKGGKFEQIVQKSVELGVYEIVPVLSRRCVSRPGELAMEKKLERYNRIALEAAKQCGRGRVVRVAPFLTYSQAITQMQAAPLALFFYENAEIPLHTALAGKPVERVSMLIGSEGGFEPSEAQQAIEAGLLPLSLGSRILRCETAPLAALAAVMFAAGEF